ncbi:MULTISPECIES: metal-dependent transcriptional regulator [Reichenbachiella]|uniref:Transcriptional regulator MntR n=1 Tax=Reichenbachiella agariperforans TaxID=156994 RepID=A0A1M6J5C7_REIAG|nr:MULTISPECIES: metal-dependent transcriptional regulator [Reichenbachiella]RJE74930.1 iron-dependent repressor [Reichenbachiella sp. MSK19-1]SHJ41827.1 iron (metal) dependent repressor, DtxR family [Reichenbachiella agariperforans]
MLSYAEENYLKAVYHLSDSGQHAVTTNAIADVLKTKPASVSDMIKKLSDKGYVSYKKYKGANVSIKGAKAALLVIRKHRLWEVFLVDKLDFKWDEVHEIAEQLEHIKSPVLVTKLDKFLGYPRVDPHGDPIPDENGEIVIGKKVPLTEVKMGKQVIVTGVENSESDFLAHLDKINISLGSKITIKDINTFDGSMQIDIIGYPTIFISKQVADNLLVTE